MRARLLALCVVFLGAVLGAAGCSSSGSGSASAAKPKETPTGTVTVSSGGKVVCVIKLGPNGIGTCKVTAGQVPGKVVYTGVYNGGPGFRPARASTTVTVKPVATQGP
jgi:hypothetical protein